MLILSIVILVIALVYFLGPRVKVDTRLNQIDFGSDLSDLDKYIEEKEKRFDDIVDGAEKGIHWSHDDKRQTDYSFVYLHGFSASRKEVSPLMETLASELAANIFFTRFSGHGRSDNAMAEGSVNSWLNDAHEAVEIGKLIGKQVIVVATSTGATAATWYATQGYSENVAAYIFLSPNFGPKNTSSELLTGPWAEQLVLRLIGKTRSWEPKSEAHARYWTESYPSKAILPMMALVKLTRNEDLGKFRTPLLTIYSPNDQVINPDRVLHNFNKIGSQQKELISIDDSVSDDSHILAGDILAMEDTLRIKTIILDFLWGAKLLKNES